MGSPQFAQRGTRGGGDTLAVNERPNIQVINLDQTGNVPAGGSEDVELFAPAGSTYEVIGMEVLIQPDADSTTDSHYLNIVAGDVLMMYAEAGYNEKIQYTRSEFTAPTQVNPTGAAAQQAVLNSLMATENEPITFSYLNYTDAAQENNREYSLVVKEASY